MAVIFYNNGKSAKKVVQFERILPNRHKIMQIIIPEGVIYNACT